MQKLVGHYLKNKPGMMAHPCDPSSGGDRGRRMELKAGPGKSTRPSLKKQTNKQTKPLKSKRLGGRDQDVEYLFNLQY
jgi:hypothetical protein